MSKSILWYQHQDPKQDDVVFLNGDKLVNQNDIQENFRIINLIANKAIENSTPWCGRINGYFFIKGLLNSKDNIGRTMSFLYVTDNKDYKSSCIAELKAAEVEISDETKNCLYNKCNSDVRKKHFITIFYVIGLLIAFTYLYMLFTCS